MEALQRVRKAVNWLRYAKDIASDKDLAEMLDYKKASFSQVMTGAVPLSAKFVKNICSLDENLNPVWILTGEGEMFKSDELNGEKSVITGDNNNWNNVSQQGDIETLRQAIEEIGEQRKLVAKAQEQIDRLISLLEQSK